MHTYESDHEGPENEDQPTDRSGPSDLLSDNNNDAGESATEMTAEGAVNFSRPSGIFPGVETAIVLERGALGLGIGIDGGTDTALKRIVICELFKEGSAAKDGRLKPGDYLLQVKTQVIYSFLCKAYICQSFLIGESISMWIIKNRSSENIYY